MMLCPLRWPSYVCWTYKMIISGGCQWLVHCDVEEIEFFQHVLDYFGHEKVLTCSGYAEVSEDVYNMLRDNYANAGYLVE